jgi:hypothetical protein
LTRKKRAIRIFIAFQAILIISLFCNSAVAQIPARSDSVATRENPRIEVCTNPLGCLPGVYDSQHYIPVKPAGSAWQEALLAGSHAAAIVLDVETTLDCHNRETCTEGNIMMKPFVRGGRKLLYPVQFAVWGLTVWRAHHARLNGKQDWWKPQIFFAVGHGFVGGLNLRF